MFLIQQFLLGFVACVSLPFALVFAGTVPQAPGTSYTSEYGAAATIHSKATQAAAQALEQGGSAIDAAIAAALTLGVVDGFNSGIGGGLFALVRYADGTVQAIDAREIAPAAATESLFIREGKADKNLSRTGALAIGIPGSVLAFEQMHERGGLQPLAHHYQQAATLAEEGFVITPHYASRIKRTHDSLLQFPESAAIFLNEKSEPRLAGTVLKQLDLASSYRRLAEQGSRWFYQNEFAKLVENWMQANGGIITQSDFANYQTVLRQPVVSNFAGHTFLGFPPPSSGGIHVAQMLNMLEALRFTEQSKADQTHLLAEVMRLAFADRSKWLGDPAYVNIPDGLLNADYLKQRLESIRLNKVGQAVEPGLPNGPDFDLLKHTSHIAVADSMGNWVSLTTSLNTSFGSKVTIPGTGVVLNNQMDDFAADPGTANLYGLVQGRANAVAAGKRPLSSMTPAMVLKDDEPILAVGAAGGPLIISQVVQAIAYHVLLGRPLDQALHHPRVHHQWQPNTLLIEKTVPQTVRDSLQAKGHELKEMWFEGSSNAVGRQNGKWVAVSEPRMVERNESQ